MRVVTWDDGRLSTQASVAVAGPLSGAALRDSYLDAVRRLTLGLVRLENNSLHMGPLEFLRFGSPAVSRNAVDWPIEGGLLAGGPGGRWRLQSSAGRVEASLSGYRPSLPRPVYAVTQLQVHQLFTRLYLLRVRGRDSQPGVASRDRMRAAAVDAAICLTLARLTGRRSLRRTLAIAIAYHVVCWSTTGRTLGALVTRQRVVAVDGSRLTAAQSLLRLMLVPVSWVLRRPVHDEIAGTAVIVD